MLADGSAAPLTTRAGHRRRRVEATCVRCQRHIHGWTANVAQARLTWRADGTPFGLDGVVCLWCYNRLRAPIRQVRRREKRAAQAPANTLSPAVGIPPGVHAPTGTYERGLAEHAQLGLRCLSAEEFARWYEGAVYAASKCEGHATLDQFCRDAAAPWCAVQREAGACIRCPVVDHAAA